MLENISQLNSALQDSREYVAKKAKDDPYVLMILGLLVGVAASTLRKKEVMGAVGLFGRTMAVDTVQYFLEKSNRKRSQEQSEQNAFPEPTAQVATNSAGQQEANAFH